MTKMNQEASFLRDKAEQLRGDKKARHELRKIYKQVCTSIVVDASKVAEKLSFVESCRI